MAEKYTESQHRATNKYRSTRTHIDMVVTYEEKAIVQSKADAKSMSIKQYIMDLVVKDNC